MANPTLRAAGTQANGSGTTVSVPPPAGHQTGDLLILVGVPWDTATMTTPSGWTLMTNGDSGAWGTSNRYRTYIFWKLATSSSEPNVTLTQSLSGFPQGQMIAVQGTIDQTTPVDTAPGWAAVDSDTTIPTLAITTVTDNALIVYIGQDTAPNLWGPPPSGATQRFETSVYVTKTAWADLTKTPAGTKAADNYTRGGTAGFGRVFAFAVRPAAAAAASTFVPQIVGVI